MGRLVEFAQKFIASLPSQIKVIEHRKARHSIRMAYDGLQVSDLGSTKWLCDFELKLCVIKGDFHQILSKPNDSFASKRDKRDNYIHDFVDAAPEDIINYISDTYNSSDMLAATKKFMADALKPFEPFAEISISFNNEGVYCGLECKARSTGSSYGNYYRTVAISINKNGNADIMCSGVTACSVPLSSPDSEHDIRKTVCKLLRDVIVDNLIHSIRETKLYNHNDSIYYAISNSCVDDGGKQFGEMFNSYNKLISMGERLASENKTLESVFIE